MRWILQVCTRTFFGLSIALSAGLVVAADVVIGQVVPLSGVVASTGQQLTVGAKIYFDHINATGGVHGQKITLRVMDDGYKGEETVRLAKELLEQPEVLALFGFAGTANIGRLLENKMLEQSGVALVAPYTGGESLRKPFNPWIFHVRAGLSEEAEHLVQHVSTLGMKRIAVMYQDDTFGRAGLAAVEAAMGKRGLKVLSAASYERNTDKVEDAVARLRVADAQAMIMFSPSKPAAAFIKGYREAGGGAQLYNVSVVDPGEVIKIAGLKNAHGFGISQVVPYPYLANMPVTREYQALLSKYAADQQVTYASFEAFLGAKVLVEALRRAGPNPTRSRVVKALESLGTLDLGGFSISYGANNRIGSRFVEVTVIGSTGKLLK